MKAERPLGSALLVVEASLGVGENGVGFDEEVVEAAQAMAVAGRAEGAFTAGVKTSLESAKGGVDVLDGSPDREAEEGPVVLRREGVIALVDFFDEALLIEHVCGAEASLALCAWGASFDARDGVGSLKSQAALEGVANARLRADKGQGKGAGSGLDLFRGEGGRGVPGGAFEGAGIGIALRIVEPAKDGVDEASRVDGDGEDVVEEEVVLRVGAPGYGFTPVNEHEAEDGAVLLSETAAQIEPGAPDEDVLEEEDAGAQVGEVLGGAGHVLDGKEAKERRGEQASDSLDRVRLSGGDDDVDGSAHGGSDLQTSVWDAHQGDVEEAKRHSSGLSRGEVSVIMRGVGGGEMRGFRAAGWVVVAFVLTSGTAHATDIMLGGHIAIGGTGITDDIAQVSDGGPGFGVSTGADVFVLFRGSKSADIGLELGYRYTNHPVDDEPPRVDYFFGLSLLRLGPLVRFDLGELFTLGVGAGLTVGNLRVEYLVDTGSQQLPNGLNPRVLGFEGKVEGLFRMPISETGDFIFYGGPVVSFSAMRHERIEIDAEPPFQNINQSDEDSSWTYHFGAVIGVSYTL